MSETNTKKQLLTGKENYLGWKRVITASLSSKGLIKNNVAVEGKEEDALNYIYQHLSFKIAGDLPTTTAVGTLDWLKSRYGDINRWDAEIDYKNKFMNGIDAADFLASLDSALALVLHAGGKIDNDVQLDTMLKGCHQEFYQDFIRQLARITVTPQPLKQFWSQFAKKCYCTSRRLHPKSEPNSHRVNWVAEQTMSSALKSAFTRNVTATFVLWRSLK